MSIETPSKYKRSSSKKTFGDHIESDIDDNISSKSNYKASGKTNIKSKSQVNTNSNNEELMSPFELVDPTHPSKR
jgi:hypothetical protein